MEFTTLFLYVIPGYFRQYIKNMDYYDEWIIKTVSKFYSLGFHSDTDSVCTCLFLLYPILNIDVYIYRYQNLAKVQMIRMMRHQVHRKQVIDQKYLMKERDLMKEMKYGSFIQFHQCFNWKNLMISHQITFHYINRNQCLQYLILDGGYRLHQIEWKCIISIIQNFIMLKRNGFIQ